MFRNVSHVSQASIRGRFSVACQALIVIALVCGGNLPVMAQHEQGAHGQPGQEKKHPLPATLSGLWQEILEHQAELHTTVAKKKLAGVHVIAFAIRDYVKAMPPKSLKLEKEKQAALTRSVSRVASLAKLLDASGDAGDSAKTAGLVIKLDKELNLIKGLYPANDLTPKDEKAAEVYTCPMHPEVTSDKPGKCTKCGMNLEQKKSGAHGEMNHSHDEEATNASIIMNATTDGPMTVGSPTRVTISLVEATGGAPVTPEMLKAAHTQRVHLLINDRSLLDYHHEHPMATGKPGEYSFSLTPLKPGPYRIWADLLPIATGQQEYAITDLNGSGAPLPISDTTERLIDTVGAFVFQLRPDSPIIKVGKPVSLLLSVSDVQGNSVKTLEPVMGAYAHVVGFETNLTTVVHIHPMGAEPTKATDRGGPLLTFHLQPAHAGFVRLFAQIQHGGKQIFARFGLRVEK